MTSVESRGRLYAFFPNAWMKVCAQVVCADAVVPLHGAIAPEAPPIFDMMAGSTVSCVA